MNVKDIYAKNSTPKYATLAKKIESLPKGKGVDLTDVAKEFGVQL